MSRERLTNTSRSRTSDTLLGEIERMERFISAADDAKIEDWADDLADEERKVVTESQGGDVKDEGDQNAKAEKNWPISASEKQRIAKKLVGLARTLIN